MSTIFIRRPTIQQINSYIEEKTPFHGYDLFGRDISGKDLREQSFDHCDFACVNMRDSLFYDTVFTKCHFYRTGFRVAQLQGAIFQDCWFLHCWITKSDLSRTSFPGSVIKHSDLRENNVATTNWKGATLHNIDMAGCAWGDSTLEGSRHSMIKLGWKSPVLGNNEEPDEQPLPGARIEACS